MKMLVLKYLAPAGFTAFAFVACGGGSSSSSGDGTDLPTDYLDVLPLVSPCGGFVVGGTAPKIPQPDPAKYCDSERFLWEYDAATKALAMTNSRVVLNCCGDHTVKVTRDGETVVFTEIDAPQASSGGMRCKCNCVFDYAAVGNPIETGMTSVRIVRNVTDDPPAKTVWEGTLDLSASAGEVVVSTDTADPWCTPPMP